MIAATRIAVTLWVLYNMWMGHVWALYFSITALTIALEIFSIVLRRTFMRTELLIDVAQHTLKKSEGE